MIITILNMRDAKNYIPKGKAIIFRMGDSLPFPKTKGEYIKKSIYYFSDVDEISDYCITEDEAEEISNTIKEYTSHVDEFVIHCQYGQGRSPAIGYSIYQYLKLNNIETKEINFLKKYSEINQTVYEKINKYLLS